MVSGRFGQVRNLPTFFSSETFLADKDSSISALRLPTPKVGRSSFMKIIGIMVQDADGSQRVVANERLVSASDPQLAETIPLDRLGARMCSAFRTAGINTYGDAVRCSRQGLGHKPNIAARRLGALASSWPSRNSISKCSWWRSADIRFYGTCKNPLCSRAYYRLGTSF